VENYKTTAKIDFLIILAGFNVILLSFMLKSVKAMLCLGHNVNMVI